MKFGCGLDRVQQAGGRMLCHRRQVFRDSPDTINHANHRRLDHSGSPHHKFVEMVCHGGRRCSINPTVRATIVVVLRCCCRNLRRRVSPNRNPEIAYNQREIFCGRFAADAAAAKIGGNARLCCVLEPVTTSPEARRSTSCRDGCINVTGPPAMIVPSASLRQDLAC